MTGGSFFYLPMLKVRVDVMVSSGVRFREQGLQSVSAFLPEFSE